MTINNNKNNKDKNYDQIMTIINQIVNKQTKLINDNNK